MRYIIQKRPGKVHVREHDRQTKHKVADVRRHERRLKDKQVLGYVKLKDLNYKQAKKRFPGLNPRGDIDKDGVINKRDCRPFDIDRQDDEETFSDWANREIPFDEEESRRRGRERAREMTEELERDILWDKANKGELTTEDMEEYELKSFDRDAVEEE